MVTVVCFSDHAEFSTVFSGEQIRKAVVTLQMDLCIADHYYQTVTSPWFSRNHLSWIFWYKIDK